MAAYPSSRAGLTAVRKISDLTATIVQQLEDDVKRRVSYYAGAFHRWHEQAILQKLGRRYEDELGQMQEAWEAHKDKLHEQTRLALDSLESREQQQKAKALATWLNGNAKVMVKTSFLAWAGRACSRKQRIKAGASVELAMAQALGNKAGALKQVALHRWHGLVEDSRRQTAAEREKALAASLAQREKDLAAQEEAFRNQRQAHLERAQQQRRAVCLRWFANESKGLLTLVWGAWRGAWEKSKAASKHSAKVQQRLRQALGASDGFLKQMVFKELKHMWEEAKRLRAHQEEWEKKLLAERAERQALESEQQKAQDRAKAATQAAVSKFLLGSDKGAMLAAFRSWTSYLQESKAAKRQSKTLITALMKSFASDAAGLIKMCFREWNSATMQGKSRKVVMKASMEFLLGQDKGLIRSVVQQWRGVVVHEQQATARERELQAKMDAKLASAMQERDDAEGRTKSLEAQYRDQQAAKVQSILRQWLGNITASYFAAWKVLTEKHMQHKQQKKSVEASIKRFLLGEKMSTLKTVLSSWWTYVTMIKEHQAEVGGLKEDVSKLREAALKRMSSAAAALIGSDSRLILQMHFGAWKEVANARFAATAEHERQVALQEMERERHLDQTRKHAKIAEALVGLGGKGKVFLLQVFLAWSVHVQKEKALSAHKLQANQSMKALAEKFIAKNLIRDAGSLLNLCFRAWIKEYHQSMRDTVREEAEREMRTLEQRIVTLEEELVQAYTQIDHIAETLQSELQSKEDLVAELRSAHSGARKRCYSQQRDTVGKEAGDALDRSLDTSIGSTGSRRGLLLDATNTPGGASTATTGRSRSYPALPGQGADLSPIPKSRQPAAQGVKSGRSRSRSTGTEDPDSETASNRFRLVPRIEGSKHSGRSDGLQLWQGMDLSDPPHCDWDSVVEQMREEGILRSDVPRGF